MLAAFFILNTRHVRKAHSWPLKHIDGISGRFLTLAVEGIDGSFVPNANVQGDLGQKECTHWPAWHVNWAAFSIWANVFLCCFTGQARAT